MPAPDRGMEALVDVVIAVHTPTRPIERPVGSVLDHTRSPVRVTVVVHNTDPEPIRDRLRRHLRDPRLRVVTWEDGIPSPSGPMNHGFDLATAPYVSLLGSDDSLEPGALDAWLLAAGIDSVADPADLPATVADVVIAPDRDGAGRLRPSPPVRPARIGMRSGRRAAVLDGARDRLAYRSAPLGLIGRRRFGQLRFAEGIETGEDQPFSATLWFTPGARVVFPGRAPGYREHHDQDDRVTFAVRSVEREFRVLGIMLAPGQPWSLDPMVRLSLAAKMIRVHLFDAVRNRIEHGWDAETAGALSAVAERILEWEPRAPFVLSRVDARLLAAVRDPQTSRDIVDGLLVQRRRLRRVGALVPSRLRFVFHPQAPLRSQLAGLILLRLGSRHR